jgi:formylglycine-generating enzyme required for sulfatase activity
MGPTVRPETAHSTTRKDSFAETRTPGPRSSLIRRATLVLLATGESCGSGSTEPGIGSPEAGALAAPSDAAARSESPSGASIGAELPDFDFPEGTTINLEPTSDCRHPEVSPSCADGFCAIPPGCFIMGAPRDEFGAARDRDVQVQVTLTRAFEIGQFEVTNQQWLDAGLDLPTREQDVGTCRDPECPISNVNLFEALTYANTLSELNELPACYELWGCEGTFGSGPICNRAGAEPGSLECTRTEEDGLSCEGIHVLADDVYACEGYRLPTEAEWEYAARAGTRTAFWTGPITWRKLLGECSVDPNLEPVAWYCFNANQQQQVVGGKPPNPWGLHDVLGNVAEWTADALYWLGYGEGPLTDPMGQDRSSLTHAPNAVTGASHAEVHLASRAEVQPRPDRGSRGVRARVRL